MHGDFLFTDAGSRMGGTGETEAVAGRFVPVEPGDRVEVRSRFDQRWSKGFEIAEVVSDPPEHSGPEAGSAFRVRRRSDGHVLPVLFSEDDVREERKGRSMWWY